MASETTSLPKAPTPAILDVKDIGHAPIVYFEGVSNFGNNGSIVNMTLATNRYLATGDGGVATDVVAVVHLRCNVAAAMDLRAALDKALLAGAPTEGGIN